MKIWITRHGQTSLNRAHLMQGRTDEPLNETGLAQARAMREVLLQNEPGLHFDAVYASPLIRAAVTGSVIGGVPLEDITIVVRLIEADFGRYELRRYYLLGPSMMLYWGIPSVFPAPPTVENIPSMRQRAHAFLRDLEQCEGEYENVLIACHGGIMRFLCGYLEDRPRGYRWYPKIRNCEVRVYETKNGQHCFLKQYRL